MTHTIIPVNLGPQHVEVATDAGLKRVLFNYGKAKDHFEYSNKRVLRPEETANIGSCLAEYAISLHFNWVWNDPWHRAERHSLCGGVPDCGIAYPPDKPDAADGKLTHTFPNGNIPVKRQDMMHNWSLVQCYIPDSVLFPLVERVLRREPASDECVVVFLTGWVRAPEAWKHGRYMHDDPDQAEGKKMAPGAILQPVPLLGPTNSAPVILPPPQSTTTKEYRDALNEHRRRVAELSIFPPFGT